MISLMQLSNCRQLRDSNTSITKATKNIFNSDKLFATALKLQSFDRN